MNIRYHYIDDIGEVQITKRITISEQRLTGAALCAVIDAEADGDPAGKLEVLSWHETSRIFRVENGSVVHSGTAAFVFIAEDLATAHFVGIVSWGPHAT